MRAVYLATILLWMDEWMDSTSLEDFVRHFATLNKVGFPLINLFFHFYIKKEKKRKEKKRIDVYVSIIHNNPKRRNFYNTC